MIPLSLQYNRGTEHDTIDVCVSNGLFLGKIVLSPFFGVHGRLQFQQATKLNDDDVNEINRVIQTLQVAM